MIHIHPQLQSNLPLATAVASAYCCVCQGSIRLETQGPNTLVHFQGLAPSLVLLAENSDQLGQTYRVLRFSEIPGRC